MPGTGPQPKISSGDSGTSSTTPATVTLAGTAMLPVPRITAASELNIHTSTAPANTQCEYVNAASSAAPLPPIAVYRARPPSHSASVKAMPKPSAMATACHTRASASSLRPAPRARATAEAMPPPMAPAEVICISITIGNTSAMPARASVPSLPTNQVSMRPTAACATMTSTLGAAMRSSVGTIGSCSRR